MTNRYLLGVDFSSAPSQRKPITVAVGLNPTAEDPVYRLEIIREIETLEAFDRMLTEPQQWLGGFDLPLSLIHI